MTTMSQTNDIISQKSTNNGAARAAHILASMFAVICITTTWIHQEGLSSLPSMSLSPITKERQRRETLGTTAVNLSWTGVFTIIIISAFHVISRQLFNEEKNQKIEHYSSDVWCRPNWKQKSKHQLLWHNAIATISQSNIVQAKKQWHWSLTKGINT